MNHRISTKWVALLAALFVLLGVLGGCQRTEQPEGASTTTTAGVSISSLEIQADERVYMPLGGKLQLKTNHTDEIAAYFDWAASNSCVTVQGGLVTAHAYGKCVVTVSYGIFSDKVMIEVSEQDAQHGSSAGSTTHTAVGGTGGSTQATTRPTYHPDDGNTTPTTTGNGNLIDLFDYASFYAGTTPAQSQTEAVERSQRGELSGAVIVPDQAPTLSAYRPMQGGRYVCNNRSYYADSNTYVVVDAFGREAFRIYRGGGYITLEEVAAYVYAFGDVPKNYVSSKKTKPTASIWGKHLRLNHSKFSGDTDRYPYEPELPDISGCGGDLQYYEIDIGTTGTTAGEGYDVRIYNNGSSIERGAARIVYARYDRNGNLIIEDDEKYVFYTYNHYNDFQQYLNYYGGWGEMFGNITGGGRLSSKTNYNPTPYVPVVRGQLLPMIGSGPAWDEAA